MMGLVYKDFLVMRKQLSYYLIFVVLYAGLTVAGVFTPFILPGIVVLVGMMLPMSSVGSPAAKTVVVRAKSSSRSSAALASQVFLFLI